jgi:hypothetical protein
LVLHDCNVLKWSVACRLTIFIHRNIHSPYVWYFSRLAKVFHQLYNP